MMAKKVHKFDPLKLHFTEARIIQGHVDCPEEFQLDKIVAYGSDCSIFIRGSVSRKVLRSELRVNVSTESALHQEEAHGYFYFHFYFAVDNLDELATQGEEYFDIIDRDLQVAVASVSYSTARGILISRFQGTAFSRFILPVVNPIGLLQDPE